MTPQHVVAMARLHHVLHAICSIYWGDGEAGSWRGTRKRGSYAHANGSGDQFMIAWQDATVVALVFDHESERSEYSVDEDDRRPLRSLRGITGAARALATRTAADFENLVTAGAWSAGKTMKRSDRGPNNGMDLLAGFFVAPEEAMFGAPAWCELASLNPAQARLAMRLAPGGKARLTTADHALLLELPDGITTIDPAAARAGQRNLASAGIAWTLPRKHITALAARHRTAETARIAAALSPDERALFEAARAGDTRAIKRHLAAGVGIDIRTVQGQWEYTPAGDTPLIQACKARTHAAALALLAAGADPNARNSFEQTGLYWATRAGWRDVVARCLAAGGDPNLVSTTAEAPLLWAAQAGDTAMVEQLVAAGADITRRTRSGVTAGERAGMHGHHALAARLR